jgi:hypothetical protein
MYVFSGEALKYIINKLAEAINGFRKMEFDTWMSDDIQKQVDEFLVTFHFKVDALPIDYTIVKPPNMNEIYENFHILNDLMDTASPNGRKTKEFIVRTTRDMYQKVNEYKVNILDMIALETGIPIRDLLNPSRLSEAIAILQSETHRSRYGLSIEGILDLVHDLEYMDAMTKMDAEWLEKAKGEIEGAQNRLTHVVPIAGRVFGVLKTYQMDYRNAVEQWGARW